MIDSTSCVALELVRAAPDATIALEQAFIQPALRRP